MRTSWDFNDGTQSWEFYTDYPDYLTGDNANQRLNTYKNGGPFGIDAIWYLDVSANNVIANTGATLNATGGWFALAEFIHPTIKFSDNSIIESNYLEPQGTIRSISVTVPSSKNGLQVVRFYFRFGRNYNGTVYVDDVYIEGFTIPPALKIGPLIQAV